MPRPSLSAPAGSALSSRSWRTGSPRCAAKRERRSRRSTCESARVSSAGHSAPPWDPGAAGRGRDDTGGGARHRGAPGEQCRRQSAGARGRTRGRRRREAGGRSVTAANSLVTTPDGTVQTLDAKNEIYDNGLERRHDIAARRAVSAKAPEEVAARNAVLTFIKLEGNLGCCVNGAGLAMAT